jgi:hypothetical protein
MKRLGEHPTWTLTQTLAAGNKHSGCFLGMVTLIQLQENIRTRPQWSYRTSPGFSQPMGPLLNEQGEIGYHHDWATIPGDTRDQANDDFCNAGPNSCPQQHGSRPRFPH